MPASRTRWRLPGVAAAMIAAVSVAWASPAGASFKQGTAIEAFDDEYTVVQGQSVVLNAIDNDSAPALSSVTVVSVGPPQHGVLATPTLPTTYTAPPDFVGDDVFEYTICDARNATGPTANCDTATITVHVTAAPTTAEGAPAPTTTQAAPAESAPAEVGAAAGATDATDLATTGRGTGALLSALAALTLGFGALALSRRGPVSPRRQ